MAPFYFDDYTNTDNFCIWLEKVLCPELRPKQLIIMNKTSFHKSPHICKSIEISAVNSSTYRPIRRTSTPLSTTGLGSKTNFSPSGAMSPIFMTDFLLLLNLIMWSFPLLALYHMY
jgi:hypothetical protein